MRKNDLIKYLQSIEGNPEVKLWNGFVQDWMDITPPEEATLYRKTFEAYLKHCMYAKSLEAGAEVEPSEEDLKHYKRKHAEVCEWEFLNIYNDYFKHECSKKRVIVLQAKPRGKTQGDRIGKMSY